MQQTSSIQYAKLLSPELRDSGRKVLGRSFKQRIIVQRKFPCLMYCGMSRKGCHELKVKLHDIEFNEPSHVNNKVNVFSRLNETFSAGSSELKLSKKLSTSQSDVHETCKPTFGQRLRTSKKENFHENISL